MTPTTSGREALPSADRSLPKQWPLSQSGGRPDDEYKTLLEWFDSSMRWTRYGADDG